MAVSFTPTFRHQAWRDGADKVEADGPNGFNRRFQQIEADLAALRDVISQIGTALDALNAAPAAQAVRTTLTPALAPIGLKGWQHEPGSAIKPSGATEASGMMPVVLPNGVRVQSLRVTGQNAGGNLTVALQRHGLAATATAEQVVSLVAPTGTFDLPITAASPALATIDNDQFRYYLTVQLDGATPASAVKVSTIQIAHIAA